MQRNFRRWRGALAAVAVASAALPAAASAATQQQIDAAVAAGAGWVQTQQQATGALSGFQGDWVITTLAAAGVNAADVKSATATQSLQDYWAAQYAAAPYGALPNANSAGGLGKAILLSSSAGIDPTRVSASVNLAASLASIYRPATGTFAATPAVNSDGFALLAMPLAHIPRFIMDRVTKVIRTSQHSDGGWVFQASTGTTPPTSASDTDMTGAALAMLCGDGATAWDPQVQAGLGFLHGKQDQTTGGFGAGLGTPANNVVSAAWIAIGMNACGVDPQAPEWTTTSGEDPIDFLLSLQRPDGSFKYLSTTATPAPSYDMNATEATVRALAGAVFSAPPPARIDPTQPRWRPAPTVAAGTAVPVALAIDDGGGAPQLCAVTIASGSTLPSVLQTAQASAVPSGCVTASASANGALTSLDGVAADAGHVWTLQIDGHAAQPAGEQAIGFGDVVSLRLTPLALTAAPTGLAFGDQPQGTIGAPLTLTLTAARDGVAPARVVLAGAAADDFLVSGETCGGATLDSGERCQVRVRFAPSDLGARAATLTLTDAAGDLLASVAASGTGSAAAGGAQGPQGPQGDTGPQGPAGAPGDAGAQGPAGPQGDAGAPGDAGAQGPAGAQGDAGAAGPQGATGAQGDAGPAGVVGLQGAAGPKGATGRPGRDAKVSCKLTTRKGRQQVRCSVSLSGKRVAKSARVTLARAGRTSAKGTLAHLRATRTLRRGARYTLTVRSGRTPLRAAVKLG